MVALAALTALSAGCDPVKSDAINALGGETPGVRNGPLHRPGQPCTLCHDGEIGDPPAFSVAGTIYETPADASVAAGATVSMLDSVDAGYEAGTNSAGNFYVTPGQWSPRFPIVRVVVSSVGGGTVVTMQSDVGRNGSCATCHFDPAGLDSPGHVYLALPDGGTPP
jgi:hypothetical protein